MNITSFKDKRLKKLASNPTKKVAGLQPGQQNRIVEIMEAIVVAKHPLELKEQPAWKTHELLPFYPGTWSLWLNGNFRLTFRYCSKTQAAQNLNIEDYH